MRFRFALFTTALAAASMLLAPPAQASTSKLSKSDLAFVTDSSQRLGIPPLVRESLIAKLEQGLVPESMTGSLPTKTDTSISPERMVTRKEFADGSVSQTTFQLPATQSKKSVGGAVVTPLSVTGCGTPPGLGPSLSKVARSVQTSSHSLWPLRQTGIWEQTAASREASLGSTAPGTAA